MANADDYSIEVLDNTDAFGGVGDAWRRLERAANTANITASFDWLRVWWSVFAKREDNRIGYNKQLRILMVRRAGELVAIVPLVRLQRRKFLVRVTFIEFLGQQWCGLFLDFVTAEPGPALTQAVLQWLAAHERYDVLHWAYLPEYTRTVDLQDSDVSLLSACPIVRAARYEDYAAYAKAMHSKNYRKHIRRIHRALEEGGRTWSFEAMAPADQHFDEIEALSKSKQKDGKRSVYANADMARFFRLAATTLPSDLEMLQIDGRAAAYRLGFSYGGGLLSFDTSYDRALRDYSPGHLVRIESLRRFFDEGRYAFHCAGTGIDEHKHNHYDEVIKIYSHIRPGNTLLGRLVARRLQHQARQIAARVEAELAGNTA